MNPTTMTHEGDVTPHAKNAGVGVKAVGHGEAATQPGFARAGAVTEAMKRVAQREGLDAELVRSEVAQG
ncbi:MAG: phosphomethylpyrimidine synthase, partial [Candidatus Omnitrophica bacterium]|nr:phosphomethylpyrimidine synthase [Candidatus Omnitrophota bacterium]